VSVRIGSRRKYLIDEYGRLHRQLADKKPLEAKLKTVRHQILSWVEAEDPASTFVFTGGAYEVQVGEKANEGQVDIPRVFRIVGAETFFSHARVPMEALKRLLDEDQFLECVDYQRTGDRLVKPLPLVTPIGRSRAA